MTICFRNSKNTVYLIDERTSPYDTLVLEPVVVLVAERFHQVHLGVLLS